MARRIVWSDFLKEEAIYRFWYTLENNNFKNAIKKAQKKGKMNYAIMHNALYSGLYYPESDYVYPYRSVKDIREAKGLKKNTVLANFMPRNEILMNIHAMNESARAIRNLAPLGYNAKLFAKEFHLIGKAETELFEKINIKNEMLLNSLPSQNELEPNKPNRYNLSRNFVLKQKSNPAVFKKDTTKARETHFGYATRKYQEAKQKFDYQVLRLNIKEAKKEALMLQFLNSGLYRTSIAYLGLNPDKLINDLIGDKNAQDYVTRKEVLLHADKLERGAKALSGIQNYKNLTQAEEVLVEAGIEARQNFIKKELAYPETKVGFLNAFCEMLSNKLELNPILKNKTIQKDTPEMADTLIDAILKLKNQYLETTNAKEQSEIDLQMKKIQKALESSNEHNI